MDDNFKRKIIIGLMIMAVGISVLFHKHQIMEQRKLTVMNEFVLAHVDPDKYMQAIDYSKPVVVYHINKGDKFIQYQVPGAPQGNFYALEGSTPTELGISDVGWDPKSEKVVKKEMRIYTATKDFDVLSSYSAPVVDNWSTPEIETQTTGHKLQLFTTCKPCFE